MPPERVKSENLGRYWDKMSEAWELSFRGNDPEQERVTDSIRKALQPFVQELEQAKHILDVGGGMSLGHYFPEKYEDLKNKIVTLDISPAMLKKNEAGMKIVSDLRDPLPLRPESMDFAISVRTLRYIPDYKNLIREMAETLQPGKRIVLVDFEWTPSTQGNKLDGDDIVKTVSLYFDHIETKEIIAPQFIGEGRASNRSACFLWTGIKKIL